MQLFIYECSYTTPTKEETVGYQTVVDPIQHSNQTDSDPENNTNKNNSQGIMYITRVSESKTTNVMQTKWYIPAFEQLNKASNQKLLRL